MASLYVDTLSQVAEIIPFDGDVLLVAVLHYLLF